MNTLLLVVSGFAIVFSIVGVLYGIAAVRFAQKHNKSSVTLHELTKLQTELTEHSDSIIALHASLAKLRARIGMRKVREDANKGDGLPDSITDPEGWKAAMRLRIHNQRFNR